MVTADDKHPHILVYFGYLVSQISTELLTSHWYIVLPCMKEIGIRCATTSDYFSMYF